MPGAAPLLVRLPQRNAPSCAVTARAVPRGLEGDPGPAPRAAGGAHGGAPSPAAKQPLCRRPPPPHYGARAAGCGSRVGQGRPLAAQAATVVRRCAAAAPCARARALPHGHPFGPRVPTLQASPAPQRIDVNHCTRVAEAALLRAALQRQRPGSRSGGGGGGGRPRAPARGRAKIDGGSWGEVSSLAGGARGRFRFAKGVRRVRMGARPRARRGRALRMGPARGARTSKRARGRGEQGVRRCCVRTGTSVDRDRGWDGLLRRPGGRGSRRP
jgi:hypothetical protein